MLRYILLFLFSFILLSPPIFAEDVKDLINVREIEVQGKATNNGLLSSFTSGLGSFFIAPPASTGSDGMYEAFIAIAFQIKNFFIIIAVIFLIIGVLKLLFSTGSDEDIKKWRSNIIWVSVGIFVMQISFSVWNTLIITEQNGAIDGNFGWAFWQKIFLPIVKLLQTLAAFGFIMMMFYAFYTIVTGGGDDEKLKKGKNIVLYSVIGFLLIKLPESIIGALYGTPKGCEVTFTGLNSCELRDPDLSASISIVGKVFSFLNNFLGILCVILVIYAGWLVIISGGDEEKLKKAKHIILYIIIGFIVLIASHAIFRFFILQG